MAKRLIVKSIYAISLYLFLLITTSGLVYSQLQKESNTVCTKVGQSGPECTSGGDMIPPKNPVEGLFSCPLDGGKITCGSKNHPVNGCGHCGLGYDSSAIQCNAEYQNGTFNAIDISNMPPGDLKIRGEPIYLPYIGSNNIEWKYLKQDVTDGIATEARQQFVGYDKVNVKSYFLQYHHTELLSSPPPSGKAYNSGEIGARICRIPSRASNCDHVHTQILPGTAIDHSKWLDAAIVFKCG